VNILKVFVLLVFSGNSS